MDTPLPSSAAGTRNPFELPALPLLQAPTNQVIKRLFVAATRMNDGKTTTCLGLYAALQSLYPRIGFIKPIGQRFVEIDGHRVDEDSYLLDTIYDVHVPIESMSPVTVDGTFTRRFLRNPEGLLPPLEDRICRAFDRVSWEKDFTLIEGTGHAGVGSVFELSNARVASLLRAKVILICTGGIGRPADEIALNKALFDRQGVEVVGAILNKVDPDKIPVITEYAGLALDRLGVPLLGVLPVQKMLTAPNLAQIAQEFDARWLNAPQRGAKQRVNRVVVGAMTARGIVDYLQPDTLIITPGDRDDIVMAAIEHTRQNGSSIAGLVLTNGIRLGDSLFAALGQTNLPVIATDEESYTVTSKIHGMTVKTQPQDTDKFPVIKRMILEHVNMKSLLGSL